MLPDKTTEIETTFLELAEQWRQETGMLSVTSKMSMHPAYQRIIGMGQPVVPLIMRELEREPRPLVLGINCYYRCKSC